MVHENSLLIDLKNMFNSTITIPILTVLITSIDVEFFLKIISLVLSMSYLIWKWRVEYKKAKTK